MGLKGRVNIETYNTFVQFISLTKVYPGPGSPCKEKKWIKNVQKNVQIFSTKTIDIQHTEPEHLFASERKFFDRLSNA